MADIEFHKPSDIERFSKTSKADALERRDIYEAAAEDLKFALRSIEGHPALLGLDVRVKAWRVANRARRMAEACHFIALESVRLYREYELQFGEPFAAEKRRRRRFDPEA
jgi:hypothetical protein